MGTKKQKQRLASNLLGVDPNAVREVFNKTSTTMPCIYLFNIGFVKDLRQILNIDKKYTDDMCVYKWGMTNSLSRRTKEHIDAFKPLDIEIKLSRYNYVDPQYMSTAEVDLSNVIKAFGFHFTFDTMEELAIMNKKNLKLMEDQYDQIAKKYIGHNYELVSKIKDLENTMRLVEANHKINEANHKIEIQRLENKLRENELLNEINIIESTKKSECVKIGTDNRSSINFKKISKKKDEKSVIIDNVKETNQYKETADIYISFLNECTEPCEMNISTVDLYKGFAEWFASCYPDDIVPKNIIFSKNIKKYKEIKKMRVIPNGTTTSGITNLRIKKVE